MGRNTGDGGAYPFISLCRNGALLLQHPEKFFAGPAGDGVPLGLDFCALKDYFRKSRSMGASGKNAAAERGGSRDAGVQPILSV